MQSRVCFYPIGMSERNDRHRRRGCGCQAALGSLVLLGLPVLFVLSFGNAPCPNGPCNPSGAANLRIAAITLVALALIIGGIVWWLVDRRDRANLALDPESRSSVDLAAKLLLVVTAGFLVYIILG